MSIVQPDPEPLGESVPDKLIDWICLQETKVPIDSIEKSILLIKKRDEFGRQKYGQSLMTRDGRNTMVDALEELGDLLQYLFKAKLNNEDCTEIKDLMPILIALVDDCRISSS